jgi:signal transduction histidine kinase
VHLIKKINIPSGKIQNLLIAGLTVISAVVIAIITSLFLYEHTVNLLTDNLKKRETSIVRTAAVQFDTNDLDQLQTYSDYQKSTWKKVVNQLIKIRASNPDIVFAYILRKDPLNPSQMIFVADSHSLNPNAKIDLDSNGIIDSADALTPPGTPYENVPIESFDGYNEPTTNKNLYQDQWGTLISGYAPIRDSNNETKAIIAVDIRADDFNKITQETFLPFLLFIVALVGVILILTSILIFIWNKRVALVAEIDKQKDELLSIVSHQLATPVSSIRWNLEMILDGDMGKLNKELEDNIKSLQDISGNLSDLVSMILDVSRIQLGRMRVERQNLDLESSFREILEIIEPKAKEKKINFEKILPKKFPPALLDKRYTHMTLENLLSNAIKYTPIGGKVSMKVAIINNILKFEVADTGIGIPKKDQSKIFEKLYRATNVVNTVDGNGFGLYVAKGAIEAQGGKIWFESEEGKGTTFFVELPLK